MANKVGNLIKEARTAAGLTQAELSKKAKNVTSAELSKAERGELRLTEEQLKAIAKVTGVTQKSLLEAAASSKYAKSSTASAKTSEAKSSSGTSVKLTSAEKTIIELYRKADADTKKRVKAILKGEEDTLSGLLSALSGGKKESKKEDGLSSLLESISKESGKQGKKTGKEDGGLLSSILQNAAKDLLK